MGSWIIGMVASIKDPAEQQVTPALAESASSPERRRPGRPEDVNPALIPLLRRDQLLRPRPPAGMVVSSGAVDDLAPVRGVAVSAAIGALLWASIAGAAWWLFSV